MRLTRTKLGFTLIELLVVITIIGILAVGGVGVFTTQLQGARDSTRTSDMKLMEGAIYQYFSDYSVYPPEATFTGSISPFVSKNLEDPKRGDSICWADSTNNNAACEGRYDVGNDSFGLTDSSFKIGIRFEKKVNFETKADDNYDGGNSDEFYEQYAGAGSSTGRTISGSGGVNVY